MQLTSDAIKHGYNLGVAEAELQDALRLSAITSNPKGNRRYKDLIFLVVEGYVLRVSRNSSWEDPPQESAPQPRAPRPRVQKPQHVHVQSIANSDECDYCGGSGFTYQDDDELGQVKVPCIH